MKKIIIYSKVCVFLFALTAALLSKAFSSSVVLGYELKIAGGQIGNPEQCNPIKDCDDSGIYRCRYAPNPFSAPVDLYQAWGSYCDLPVNDWQYIE